jgi:hypothetical protein
MEHSDGMLHLHNFNEDFTFALDRINSECAGVYQVKPTDTDPHHLSVSAFFNFASSFALSSLVELTKYCQTLLYAYMTLLASNHKCLVHIPSTLPDLCHGEKSGICGLCSNLCE